MAERGEGVGHGKLILCGEHAVVHCYPAIALAIDRATRVCVARTGEPLRIDSAFADARLEEAVRTVIGDGWAVAIDSDLPVGRGLGSSAALAVALVRAEAASRGERPTPDQVHERAFAVEQVFHGDPSGVDHAVAAQGGVVRFERGPRMQGLPTPSWSLAVLDSGASGNTAQLVAGVAARRPGIDRELEAIGGLVDQAARVLDDVERLGPLLIENHRLLQAIGVSTPRLDALVDIALQAGAAGAKLSGAGGGGVVIALTHDPAAVVAAAAAEGIQGFVCRPWSPS